MHRSGGTSCVVLCLASCARGLGHILETHRSGHVQNFMGKYYVKMVPTRRLHTMVTGRHLSTRGLPVCGIRIAWAQSTKVLSTRSSVTHTPTSEVTDVAAVYSATEPPWSTTALITATICLPRELERCTPSCISCP